MSGLLPALILFGVAMFATPGPNNFMLTASGANFGFRRTIPHVAGVAVGFPVMTLLVGLGLGSVLNTHPEIHNGVRWIGMAYMLWLAVRIAMARRPEPAGIARAPRRSRPLNFIEAVLFQWINPKGWVAVAAAIGTFVSLGSRLWPQIWFIAAIFFLITVPVASAWAGIGAGVGAMLRTDRQYRLFNLTMAGLLMLSVVLLFYET